MKLGKKLTKVSRMNSRTSRCICYCQSNLRNDYSHQNGTTAY